METCVEVLPVDAIPCQDGTVKIDPATPLLKLNIGVGALKVGHAHSIISSSSA